MRRRATAAAFLVYLVLALVGFAHVWANGATTSAACSNCADAAEDTWFFGWMSFALTHAHNPLFSLWVDAPRGVNLAVNASVPLPAGLVTPISRLWGPLAGLNVALTLALPVSATAAFVALRRWVRWAPAAFVGGLLYGFSVYMTAQAGGHLQLSLVPIPPLLLVVLHELLVRQSRPAVRTGLWLGLLGAIQLYISTEVLATTAIMSAIAVVGLVATGRLWGRRRDEVRQRDEVRRRARHALIGLGVGAGVVAVLGAYPLWLATFGPRHITGPVGWPNPLSANLLGPFIPSGAVLLRTQHLAAVANQYFRSVDTAENGAYLGIPLVIVAAALAWRLRRNPMIAFASFMAGASFLLALGPSLHVGTHDTGVPLPARVLGNLPLTDRIIPARFTLYTTLFVAIILAIGIDHCHERARAHHEARDDATADIRCDARPARSALLGAVVLASLVPLIPAWPYPTKTLTTPAAMSARALCPVAHGGVVVTYPLPYPFPAQPMLWQAEDNFCFRSAEAYLLVPVAGGQASFAASSVTAAVLQAFYTGAPLRLGPPEYAEVRSELRTWDAQAVVLLDGSPGEARAQALFTQVLGRPPTQRSGALQWALD